jgi:hypothetical protein
MKKHNGKLLGIPFEPRRPTAARFTYTYWSAQNPKLFPPKVTGIGWGINFYWVIHPLRWLKVRKLNNSVTTHDVAEEPSEHPSLTEHETMV